MRATSEPTTAIEKIDRCGDLSHRPRVLLGKMGLDGHDRGVKLIARLMRDSGIHVIYSGLWQTPRSLAIGARDEDVDCIACSMMSNSHLVLVPNLLSELAAVGRPKLTVNVGGIIPQEDVATLKEAGVHAMRSDPPACHIQCADHRGNELNTSFLRAVAGVQDDAPIVSTAESGPVCAEGAVDAELPPKEDGTNGRWEGAVLVGDCTWGSWRRHCCEGLRILGCRTAA